MRAPRLLFLVVAVVLALHAPAAPLFRQPLPVDLGRPVTRAGAMVAADFNGDSHPDLAAAHENGTLYVTPGNATGPFAPVIVRATGIQYMESLVAGDVDRDGDQDLLYLAQLDLGVLVNDGGATFTPGPPVRAVHHAMLAVGDVDGDGNLDAVTATNRLEGWDGAELAVQFGNGGGGFAAAVKTPAADPFHHAKRLMLADVTGDGKAEVIVSSTRTYVYSVTGTGSLQSLWSGVGGEVAAGHLNGDGSVDLVIHGTTGDASTLFALLGAGNGQFTQIGTAWTPNGAGARIACADFTGDHVNDVLVMSGVLSILPGVGDGSFAAPLVTTTGAGPYIPTALATGDFDRDGKNDAVTATSSSTHVLFHRGNGDGTFRDDRAYVARNSTRGSYGLSALDMNGDVRPDATTLQASGAGTRDILVMLNDGSGGLLPAVVTPTDLPDIAETIFRVGKIDGDDWPDAVVIAYRSGGPVATTYLGNGDATFTQSSSRAVTWSYDTEDPVVELADVTGDGATDLLIERNLHEGNGDGSFDDARAAGVSFDALGDVDGNGTVDVIWQGIHSPILAVALNTGGGNFAAPVFFGTTSDDPQLLADFDGDGKLDLLCTTLTGTRVYGGNGDGTFRAPVDVVVTPAHKRTDAMNTADFDGDGVLDLSFGTDVVLGNGDGRFRYAEFDNWSYARAATAVGDFDGDGSADILGFLGGLAFVHLNGLVPEPAQTTTVTLTRTAPAEHAVPVTYRARTTGGSAPVDGVILFAIDGVPVVLLRTASTTNAPASTEWPLALQAGEREVAARFLGNATYLPSTAAGTVLVDRATTTLEATPSPSWRYGSKLTVWRTLRTATRPELPGPSTTAYVLKEGGVELPDVRWDVDSLEIGNLSAGSHTLTLEFLGDEHYKPSASTFTRVVAKRKAYATHLFAPAGLDRVAGPVTATLILSEPDGGGWGATTGTVTFSVGEAAFGTPPLVDRRASATRHFAAGTYVVKMQYSGDANNEPVTYSVSMPVYLAPGAPIPVVATGQTHPGQASLSWPPAVEASSYVLYARSSKTQGWQAVATVSGATEALLPLPAGVTRAYAVAIRRADGTTGPAGPPDLATGVAFTNNPVVRGMSIRATDVAELRTAVNAVRAFAELSAFPFTDTTLKGARIRALHLLELRDALTQARNAIGMPMAFGPQAPAPGGRILSTHVEELRAGVQ